MTVTASRMYERPLKSARSVIEAMSYAFIWLAPVSDDTGQVVDVVCAGANARPLYGVDGVARLEEDLRRAALADSMRPNR